MFTTLKPLSVRRLDGTPGVRADDEHNSFRTHFGLWARSHHTANSPSYTLTAMKSYTTILLLALFAPASAATVASSYDAVTGGRTINGTYDVAEGSTLYLSGWSQSDNGNNGGWTAMLWSITPQLNQQFKVQVSYDGVRYTRDSCELQPNSGTANYNAGCLGDDCDYDNALSTVGYNRCQNYATDYGFGSNTDYGGTSGWAGDSNTLLGITCTYANFNNYVSAYYSCKIQVEVSMYAVCDVNTSTSRSSSAAIRSSRLGTVFVCCLRV